MIDAPGGGAPTHTRLRVSDLSLVRLPIPPRRRSSISLARDEARKLKVERERVVLGLHLVDHGLGCPDCFPQLLQGLLQPGEFPFTFM